MAERLRWRIANLMNRLPGQCWADLVSWVLNWSWRQERTGNPRWWLPWRPNTSCRPDVERTGCCYCGKLRQPEPR